MSLDRVCERPKRNLPLKAKALNLGEHGLVNLMQVLNADYKKNTEAWQNKISGAREKLSPRPGTPKKPVYKSFALK